VAYPLDVHRWTVVESSVNGQTWNDYIHRAYGRYSDDDLKRDLNTALEADGVSSPQELSEHIIASRGGVLPTGTTLRLVHRQPTCPPVDCLPGCPKMEPSSLIHWLGHNTVGTNLGHSLQRVGLVFIDHIRRARADGRVHDLRNVGDRAIGLLDQRLREYQGPFVSTADHIDDLLDQVGREADESVEDVRPQVREALEALRSGTRLLRAAARGTA